MSRNFELLSRLGEQSGLFQSQVSVDAATAHSRPHAITPEEVSEEEVKLVQRVFLAPGREAPRTVVFCGVEERDGSSPMCARVSEILAAHTAGSVCVVDADFNVPALHRRYGTENHLGITDAVLELGYIRNFARQIKDGNLWLLPVGSRPAESPVVFSLDHYRNRISELREQFSYVLVSAPPVNLYADAILLGQLADGVILVLKANSTRRATALRAKESLEASNVRVLGAILRERTFPIPEAIYRRL